MTMTLDGSNGVTFNDASLQGAAASPYVLKNRIINGAMVIDQRNAGAATANTINSYTLDRWKIDQSASTGKLIVQQNAAAVTPPAGFTNYLGVTSQSSYAVLAGDEYLLTQNIEGYNVSDLDFGKATAKTITISFWVRSSLTGTFGASLGGASNLRFYPFSYTISVANTWEYKTVTIAGDTSGTWLTTNGIGMYLRFGLGVGTTYGSGTANAWTGTYADVPTGSTSVVATNGATFYITGVQLEIGSTATPFERRLYNAEFANCQRYYYKWINNSGSARYNITLQAYSSSGVFGKLFDLPVTMRSQPTATASGTFTAISANGTLQTAFSGKTVDSTTTQTIATGGWTGSSGLVAGNCTILEVTNSAYIEVSAEL